MTQTTAPLYSKKNKSPEIFGQFEIEELGNPSLAVGYWKEIDPLGLRASNNPANASLNSIQLAKMVVELRLQE
ncbi:hypothetical protein [uncultured Tateyamaria sp.]|uniref:hypothetical protein n=1 Tax=uncultured Tateyamaria sp. TaxID=455651 RepID=UPI002613D446|nr:hypothetical protein [uncultured Tateyamaria sp.]